MSFALGLLKKDLDTFYDLAKGLQVPTPAAALLKELYSMEALPCELFG